MCWMSEAVAVTEKKIPLSVLVRKQSLAGLATLDLEGACTQQK